MSTPWQGLLANLGVIAILVSAWAYTLEWTRPLPARLQSLALVLAAGGGAVVLMALPFEIQPGVIFDLRAVPIAIAGFFGGPIVGAAVGVVAALYRFWLGGVGAAPATISIGVVTVIGIVGHALLAGRLAGPRVLVLLAAATALGGLSGLFFLPDGLWRTALPLVALPGISLVFVAVLTAGGVIQTELRRIETSRENRIYRAVIDALPEPLNAKDPDGRFVAANPATAALMHAGAASALIGKTDFDFYPPDIAATFRADEEAAMASGQATILEQRVERRDGSSAWLSTLKVPLLDDHGAVIGLLTHNRDITGLKQLRAEHDAAQRLLADALANMADGLAVYDRDNRLVMCNEQYRNLFPRTAHLRVPGASFADILRAMAATGEQAVPGGDVEAWVDRTCRALHTGGDVSIELGDGRWLRARIWPGKDGGALVVISDVTTQREAERKLAELNRGLEALARVDGLTGLSNRRTFEETLEGEFKRSVRTGAPLSLLMLDVDHFKALNDTYGHPAGDDCLKAIARTLGAAMRRPGDVAARYGGEELVAILPETDAEGALSRAEAVRTAVRDLAIPHIGNPPGIVTVSIGVATRAGRGADRAAQLVRRADDALYAAKAGGRDRVVASRPRIVRPADGASGAPSARRAKA